MTDMLYTRSITRAVARITETIDTAKENLQKELARDKPDFGMVAKRSIDLMEYVGELEAYEVARSCLAQDKNPTEILTSVLLRGADDTWSGRTNDTSRSKFDGFRRGAQNVMQRYSDNG